MTMMYSSAPDFGKLKSLFHTLSVSWIFTALFAGSAVAASESNKLQGLQQASIQVPASVAAFYSTELYAKESGYISSIHADIGDHVKKHQVLAVIDNPELQQGLAKAQAALQQAKAGSNVTQQQLASLQAEHALQQITLKRQEELFAGKAITDQQLDESKAKSQVSGAGVAVGLAKIEVAAADILAANAEVKRLQSLLQYTKIVAPFDCVVTRRLVNQGDLVQAATASRTLALYTCQQINVVRVVADVPETRLAGLGLGWIAEIRPSGASGSLIRAKITRIAKALDATTRTMRIEIDVPNADEKLLPGMYTQVTLIPPVNIISSAAVTRTKP